MVSVVGLFVVIAFVLLFVAVIFMGNKSEEGNKQDKKEHHEEVK